MESIKLVILESPYAGDVEANLEYARSCALDCARRGESPQASHLLFTQFLDDADPIQREIGVMLGVAWRSVANYSVFYTDRGWSSGMLDAFDSARKQERPYKLRAMHGYVRMPPRWLLPLDVYEAIDRTRAPARLLVSEKGD
jgi:hypothetical protein